MAATLIKEGKEYILQRTQNLVPYLMALQHNVVTEAIHSARAAEEHVLTMAASTIGYKHL